MALNSSSTLVADPQEMARIVWTAIDRTRQAREHLEAGDIDARAKAISEASQALSELSGALDQEVDGELSRQLAQLYDYMQWRLVDANFHQTVAPLNEVLGLLTTLSEAWQTTQFEPRGVAPRTRRARWAKKSSAETPQYATQALRA